MAFLHGSGFRKEVNVAAGKFRKERWGHGMQISEANRQRERGQLPGG